MSTGRPDGSTASPEDVRLVAALRAGDEAAFATLVEQYHGTLLRLALLYVPTRAVAQDVVQDTWIGVLRGLERFEGRSSLRTWLYTILLNKAKTRGRRESKSIPFSALWDAEAHPGEPAVEPARFRPFGEPWAGGWESFPRHWNEIPEDQLLSQEVAEHIRTAIGALEPSQREVITLRDIEGWSSAEVCNVLGIRETNQRVLLHRARSKVRRALERYFDDQGLSEPTP